ncbi:hypothetical protein IMZ48_02270 [Candidatus Bathyarchaeota archaeon]|nr:hypothetical protein [Candidatus Bathyarchaeota archaeon]
MSSPYISQLPQLRGAGTALLVAACGAAALFLAILLNAFRQMLPRKKSEPPLIFHWIPFIGNAVSYGMNPLLFYQKCQKKVRRFTPETPPSTRALAQQPN